MKRPDGIRVTKSHTVGSERPPEPVRVARCLGSLDEAIRAIHRLPTGTGKCKGDYQPCPDVNVGVAAPMAFFPFCGWKNSFYGDLHAHGRDAVAFYTEQKVIMSRWF